MPCRSPHGKSPAKKVDRRPIVLVPKGYETKLNMFNAKVRPRHVQPLCAAVCCYPIKIAHLIGCLAPYHPNGRIVDMIVNPYTFHYRLYMLKALTIKGGVQLALTHRSVNSFIVV